MESSLSSTGDSGSSECGRSAARIGGGGGDWARLCSNMIRAGGSSLRR